MNKFLKVFMVLSIPLLLVGCGKVATLKNGEQKIAEIKGKAFSANNLYDLMLEKYGAEKFIELVDTAIYDEMYKNNSDDENEYIKSQIKDIKDSAEKNKTSFEETIKYYGFDDEKSLKEYLLLNYRRDQAVNDYVGKKLTDEEINDYYESNIYGDIKARHILISTNEKDGDSDKVKKEKDEKAKKTATEVLEKVKKGEKFADLAKKYSTDPGTKDKGGDLGFFSYGDMVEEFDKAAFALKKGEYTKELVKTTYGYHIILKEDEKAKPKLKDVKSKIVTELTKNKLSEDTTLKYTTLDEIRKDKGLKFEDDKLRKQYNAYVDKQISQAKQSATSSN